jgi:hypothetical protein
MKMQVSDRVIRFGLKPLVFLASLAPAAFLTWAVANSDALAVPKSSMVSPAGFRHSIHRIRTA